MHYNNKDNNTLNNSNMEKKVFYVAFGGKVDYMNPTLVEQFDNAVDADTYAALMSRTKQRRYIVLEQITEWDGTVLEANKEPENK